MPATTMQHRVGSRPATGPAPVLAATAAAPPRSPRWSPVPAAAAADSRPNAGSLPRRTGRWRIRARQSVRRRVRSTPATGRTGSWCAVVAAVADAPLARTAHVRPACCSAPASSGTPGCGPGCAPAARARPPGRTAVADAQTRPALAPSPASTASPHPPCRPPAPAAPACLRKSPPAPQAPHVGGLPQACRSPPPPAHPAVTATLPSRPSTP
ncbi:hypothetical protein LMG19145_03984 [Xanthomonas arboricola pv. fragariae]|nr:hypothetical protein LMG19145_03984 [Xanthomonas arboricola pv. fragariae]